MILNNPHNSNNNSMYNNLHLYNQINQSIILLIINKLNKIIIPAIYHKKIWLKIIHQFSNQFKINNNYRI